ncbi:hypothetical protein CRG98_026039, partial [Punica granatum]
SSGIVPKPEDVEDFQNFPGEGIYGRIDERDFFIGNKKIATKAGSQIVPNSGGDNAMGGKTVGYIYLGADLVGMFSLSDECRTGVIEAIRELKSRNIRTVMLTGDCQAAAMNAQNQLGNALDQVYAELLPEDKSKIIQQLQTNGRTAMVGDGINDAPALATSDIGISMGISGSALATETGHVILMSNDIRKIPKAINLARRAHRKVTENVFLSFLTRVAILALAFAGHPLVWAAVLADTGTCLLVIMNSMLLLRGQHKHRHVQKCSRQSCGAPKEQRCICDDISSDQNHQQCCNEKSCTSSVLPPVHPHHPHESKGKVQQNCCESTKCTSKQRCTGQKVSCEPRSCSSVQKSARECHPSQFTTSEGEIIEIPSSGRKQGCCTGNSTAPNRAQSESGTINAANHSSESAPSCCSGNKCSKSPTPKTNVVHAVSDGIGDADRCCSRNCDTVRGKAMTCCTTNDLEKNLHAPASTCRPIHGGHCDQTHYSDEQRTSCGLQGCASPGPHCERDCSLPNELGPHHTEIATALHACCSLENREIGGCCRSYMKECCKSHHGHLGHHGFGGCLTEIIID